MVLAPVISPSDVQTRQRAAARWLSAREYTQADVLAEELLRTDPQSQFNIMLRAEALTGTGQADAAEALYDQISEADRQLQLVATYRRAEQAFGAGQARRAEQLLKKTLELHPGHLDACRKLAYLMRVEGRIWESEAPVRELIRQGNIRNDHLSMLGSRAVIVDEPLFIQKCRNARPDDPLPLLGEATLHLLQNRDDQAEELLTEIIRIDPRQFDAQAGLGRLLTDQQRDAEFLAWHSALQPSADQHPQIWYVRGRYLSRIRRHEEAARCFLETLSRSPNHVEATYLLSQSLEASGRTEQALKTAQRAERLAAAEITMSTLAHGITLEDMKKAAAQLADLQRYWEAAAMCYLVVEGMTSREEWAETGLRDNLARLDSDVTFKPGLLPFSDIRIDELPLPDWSTTSAGIRSEQTPSSESGIAFVENAREVGLEFQYYNGSLQPKGLEHIFETTGGGVAVLDFDADHWPDLWLAQGNSVWSTEKSQDMSDAVFRNIDGTRYQNITAASAATETGFSQGVTTGDINSDGFPDVYVGNVGPNTLWINNGDGTFTDVTDESGVGGDEWTLSPAIVDLNNDGHPEIYSLSYLNRAEVLERRCRKNGKPLTCAPTMFTAEQDRLYQNSGDGQFREVTQTCGIVRDAGNGLGLVAADFDHSGRISLFIGNDTTNNFYFRNESTADGQLRFTEEALLTGLACDGLGKAQATMGIAADDCNGDGELDLFITNFYGTANTLFQSDAAGSWSDQTRSAQLFNSSIEQLGFGCQFLDADLDGWPDLIITNGHVDRSDATSEPDEMCPQFYRNHSGQFEELSADTVGKFFAGKYLGRSLSTLDWNRDGRVDSCISHLFTPTALLTNTSSRPGNSLRFRLIGTTVDRDAVGTSVTVSAGEETWVKQITLGNGYESTNERLLTFGLGSRESIDRVTIVWLTGETQVLTEVPVNAEISVIEGQNHWIRNRISSTGHQQGE